MCNMYIHCTQVYSGGCGRPLCAAVVCVCMLLGFRVYAHTTRCGGDDDLDCVRTMRISGDWHVRVVQGWGFCAKTTSSCRVSAYLPTYLPTHTPHTRPRDKRNAYTYIQKNKENIDSNIMQRTTTPAAGSFGSR